MKKLTIEAKGLLYPELNEKIRIAVSQGIEEITIHGVNGQRYIGGGLKGKVRIVIDGVPGNDLASFMDGATIVVKNNGQDGISNTMNNGEIIIHGHAGDILGYAMRGGRIFVKENVGYRVGIHMKSYMGQNPVIVVGGSARDFLGEYMAGGIIIILGLNGSPQVVGEYIGVGMHGGVIYIRGEIEDFRLGREVQKAICSKMDREIIHPYLKDFERYFGIGLEGILKEKFTKLIPHSQRPYGKIYAY